MEHANQWGEFIIHSTTSGQHRKGKLSHLGSTSVIVPHCVDHTFSGTVGALLLLKQTAHIAQLMRSIQIINVWVHCAYTVSQDARLECTNAVWYMQRYPGQHTIVQWCQPFPTMQCKNLPLLVCHWWRYELGIHSIDSCLLKKDSEQYKKEWQWMWCICHVVLHNFH